MSTNPNNIPSTTVTPDNTKVLKLDDMAPWMEHALREAMKPELLKAGRKQSDIEKTTLHLVETDAGYELKLKGPDAEYLHTLLQKTAPVTSKKNERTEENLDAKLPLIEQALLDAFKAELIFAGKEQAEANQLTVSLTKQKSGEYPYHLKLGGTNAEAISCKLRTPVLQNGDTHSTKNDSCLYRSSDLHSLVGVCNSIINLHNRIPLKSLADNLSGKMVSALEERAQIAATNLGPINEALNKAFNAELKNRGSEAVGNTTIEIKRLDHDNYSLTVDGFATSEIDKMIQQAKQKKYIANFRKISGDQEMDHSKTKQVSAASDDESPSSSKESTSVYSAQRLDQTLNLLNQCLGQTNQLNLQALGVPVRVSEAWSL